MKATQRGKHLPIACTLARLGLALALSAATAAGVLATPGDLDPSFGAGGVVVTDLGISDFGTSLALQPDGKIVVAGASGYVWDFALVRYQPDGSLDPTFGVGGIVTTDLGGTDCIQAVVLQPDAKIVAIGHTWSGSSSNLALVRYDPDGNLDLTFGSNGIVTTDLGGSDFARGAILQPDSKIVVAGETRHTLNDDFAVVRYSPDGTLDPTFGVGGIVTTSLGRYDLAYALALQPDAKILVAGFAEMASYDFALARYTAEGDLDLTFGISGTVTTDFGHGTDYGHTVAFQPDGKIVVAGLASNGQDDDLALVRYLPDGSLDPSFGISGTVTTDLDGRYDRCYGLALQPDGKIVAAGLSFDLQDEDFALARYQSNGDLDAGLGVGGIVLTDIDGSDNYGLAVALQPDGRIVVAGTMERFEFDGFALARYLNPQATFYLPLVLRNVDFGEEL